MKKNIASLLIGAALSAAVVGPIAFRRGQGPAIRVVSITPLGPGRPGGVLPLLVDGNTRDGCIPIVARSITRLILNKDGKVQLIKEPLTNVPLVAYDPKPTNEQIKEHGFDHRKIVPLFLPNGIPSVEDFGSYLLDADGQVEPWKLQTDSSPFACGLAEMLLSLYRPSVIAAHDIPIEILPPLLAAVDTPRAERVGKKEPQ